MRIARSSIFLQELNKKLPVMGARDRARGAVDVSPSKAITKEIRKAYNNFVPSVPCTDTAAMIAVEPEYPTLVGAKTPETIVREFTHDNVREVVTVADVTKRVWWITRFKRIFGSGGVPYLSAGSCFL